MSASSQARWYARGLSLNSLSNFKLEKPSSGRDIRVGKKGCHSGRAAGAGRRPVPVLPVLRKFMSKDMIVNLESAVCTTLVTSCL